jgi:hypothetical protein
MWVSTKIGLEIVLRGGTDDEKVRAEKIAPVRADGNLLLC